MLRESATWFFVSWIIVGGGAITSNRVTEAQCRTQIEFLNANPGALMEVTCTDPQGKMMATIPVSERQRLAKERSEKQKADAKARVEM